MKKIVLTQSLRFYFARNRQTLHPDFVARWDEIRRAGEDDMWRNDHKVPSAVDMYSMAHLQTTHGWDFPRGHELLQYFCMYDQRHVLLDSTNYVHGMT